MPLDRGIRSGVSYLSPLFMWETTTEAQGIMPLHDSAGLFHFPCPWSLTASIPRPQIVNRRRAVAPQDIATPGIDRVRQRVATPGLQIPLESQYGDLRLASAQCAKTAFDIVAQKFLKIEA